MHFNVRTLRPPPPAFLHLDWQKHCSHLLALLLPLTTVLKKSLLVQFLSLNQNFWMPSLPVVWKCTDNKLINYHDRCTQNHRIHKVKLILSRKFKQTRRSRRGGNAMAIGTLQRPKAWLFWRPQYILCPNLVNQGSKLDYLHQTH